MVEHKHLMAIAESSNPPKDVGKICSWMKKLVHDLGMVVLIKPKARYCDTVGNRGLTCICAIETSHIVLHAWDEGEIGLIQLDVYTCAELNTDVVWNSLKQFETSNIKYKFYDRKNNFTLLEEKP